jgi:hypothetical protein
MTIGEKKERLTVAKLFLIGFVIMNIGGICLFVRDAQTDDFYYNLFARIGYVLAISGFGFCLVSMIKHWIRFFSDLRRKP